MRLILPFFLFSTLSTTPIWALNRAAYESLQEELKTLIDGAGEIWAYSGNGGYILKFEKDVSGDSGKELFVNFSVRPNLWHVYTGNDEGKLIGAIEFPSVDFIHTSKEDGRTRILRSYSADSYAESPFEPFGNYVLEQIISNTDIKSKIRKVGVDATENEFNSLKLGMLPVGLTWAKPTVQAITMGDLLLKQDIEWFEFNPDNAQVRNGYYRLPGDEDRIGEFEKTFTPKVALKILNQKLEIAQPIDKEIDTIPGSSAQATSAPPVQQTQSATSPTQAHETKSTPTRFLVISVVIVVAALNFFWLLLRKRK